MLALAAARVEPNWRAEHAIDWAMYKRWIALDAVERGQIAAALWASCGRTSLPDAVARIAPAALLDEAIGWGLTVRLCRRMTAGTGLSLLSDSLRRTGDKIVLTIGADRRDLIGASVEKDLRNLAKWYHCESEIVVLQDS